MGFIDILGEITNKSEVNGARVSLLEKGNLIDSLFVDKNGEYDFRLNLNTNYEIQFHKKNFPIYQLFISTKVPEEQKQKVWTLKFRHEVFTNDSLPLNEKVLLGKYNFKKSEGGKFSIEEETNSSAENKKNNAPVIIEEEDEEVDSFIASLLADGIIENYEDYTEPIFEEEQKKVEELKLLKNKTKRDSLLLLQRNAEIQQKSLNNAKYTLKLARLNAKNREDSLLIKEKENQILKAEKRLEKANHKIKLKNYELENQRIILISSLSGLVLILILFFIVYRSFKERKKFAQKLELKNEELENQRKGLEKANFLLSMQNLEITASISYAKRIQDAILPTETQLKKQFKDYFLLYRPKDIVSGDFYWMSKLKGKIYFAVVDCTGHGVPGAFMSIIGNRLLDDILLNQEICDPSALLEKLDQGVKETLQQSVTENNDGMDVCLCMLETVEHEKTKLTFSGAKRPLFYYEKELEKIKILKGDRKPIGGRYYQDVNFTNKEIILSKGDIIFLTSDGIMDQNGPDLKKLGTRKFIEIIQENAKKTMSEQKNALELVLDNHQQGEDQRDDISVIAVKL